MDGKMFTLTSLLP